MVRGYRYADTTHLHTSARYVLTLLGIDMIYVDVHM